MFADERDFATVRDRMNWPGDRSSCHLKQRTPNGRDYAAFGYITLATEPVTVYIKPMPGKPLDSAQKRYPTFQAMFEDNWLVD